MNNSLDIFDFSDYRDFLKAWIAMAKKNQTSNVSRLAGAIGVHTSFLAHVLSGNKNLSFEQATELSEVLGLTTIEREYFFAILQIEKAGTAKLKSYWTEKKKEILSARAKVKSRVGDHRELSAEDRAVFYSSWIYVAVFVATAIDDGQTLEQISERFGLTRTKAEEILNFLTRTGVCDLTQNKFKMGTSRIFIGNESPLVVKHHTNWRMKAIQKMDNRQEKELFFTSPMSISEKDLIKIREVLSKSIQSSLDICKDSSAEKVVCLNIDFFELGD